MTRKQLQLALEKKGATLCFGYDREGEESWWLEPSRLRVRRDQAEQIIALLELVPNGDSLFSDFRSQTWKLPGRRR